MLTLLIAQLVWWLIFFAMNQKRTMILEKEVDRLNILVASGKKTDSAMPDFLEFDKGEYRIKKTIIDMREKEQNNKFLMLIYETAVVILVISYGSYRVFRSIRNELRLHRERHLFLQSVSHELKTPLATILLNLQTLVRRKLSVGQKKEILENSIDNVHRLTTQVENLLIAGSFLRERDLAMKQVKQGTTDMVAEIKRYLQEHKTEHKRLNTTIKCDMPGAIKLDMNKEMFKRICSNLIQNAIQYSGERPEIEIELRAGTEGQGTILRISDNGPGIPADEAEKIFQPLYRLPDGESPIRGTGMGLYIVHEIVRLAGGSVIIKSEDRPGTIVEITLPESKS